MDAEEIEGQPVDEPVVAAGQSDTVNLEQPLNEPTEDASGTWGGKASEPDDGIPPFDEEDSEEVEATLPEDSYDEAQAEPDGEGPQ